METLIALLVWGSIGYFLYLKFKRKAEIKEAKPSNMVKAFKKQNITKSNINTPTKARSIHDDVKDLKSTLRKLRKKAENMERYDEDGVDDVYKEIEHYEKIINPYEIKKLVEKVTDLKSYRALEKRQESLDYNGSSGHEEMERQALVIEEALYAVGSKSYKYVVCINVYVDTPLDILKKNGKAFPYNEAMAIKSSCDRCEVSEVTFDEIDELDFYIDECKENADDNGIKDLIKLRTVFENDLFDEIEKEKKINSIVSKSYILKELYFDGYGDDDYYDQYLFKINVQELSEYDIPKIEKFIARGYTTIEKIINVPSEEIGSWEGVGKITLDRS